MQRLGKSRRALFLSDRQDPSFTLNDADVTAELQIDISAGVKDVASSPRLSANGNGCTHHCYGERAESPQKLCTFDPFRTLPHSERRRPALM